MDENQLKIYSERYAYHRAEVLQRLANRYLLLKALLTVIGSGIVVAHYFDFHAIGYAVCVAISALGLLAYGENSHIRSISDYLISIERKIDKDFTIRPAGWERFSRNRKSRLRLNGTRFLAFGSIIAYELVYFAFNLQASFAIENYSFLSFLDRFNKWKIVIIVSFAQLWALVAGAVIFTNFIKFRK